MAGLEELTPPLSSSPDARLWAQIKALQSRMATQEARRNVVVRAAASGSLTTATADGTDGTNNWREVPFSCSGRPLYVTFGSNLLGPDAVAATISFTVTGTAVRVSVSHVATAAPSTWVPSSVGKAVFSGVIAGDYIGRVSVPNSMNPSGRDYFYAVEILELPS